MQRNRRHRARLDRARPGVVLALTEPLLANKKNHPLLRPLLERAADHDRADPHNHIGSLDQLRRTEPDPAGQRLINERILATYTSHANQLGGIAHPGGDQRRT